MQAIVLTAMIAASIAGGKATTMTHQSLKTFCPMAFDYNFYNDKDISSQIKHSGIDRTVKGFKTESDLKQYLEA